MVNEPPRPLRRVLGYVRHALSMTQTELGEAVGLSRRTIIRWERGQSVPVADTVRQLAELVRPELPELADEVLAAANVYVPPAPPPPAEPPVAPPPPPVTVPAYAVDAVVYAAAEAMNGTPQQAKPAVAAAFGRAKEIGISVEFMVEGLLEKKKRNKLPPTA